MIINLICWVLLGICTCALICAVYQMGKLKATAEFIGLLDPGEIIPFIDDLAETDDEAIKMMKFARWLLNRIEI